MDNEDDSVWGDEDDDDLMMATQLIEIEEEKRMQVQPASFATPQVPTQSISINQAVEAFSFRRQHLGQQSDSEQFQYSESMLSEDPESCAKRLHTQWIKEKSKNQQLHNDLLAAQGESTFLRRKVESLKHNQQEELISRFKREHDDRQKHEDQIKQLKSQIQALNTDLRVKSDEVANVKAKAAAGAYSGGRSVGGAHTPGKSPLNLNTSATSSKFRSDPNLSSPRILPAKQNRIINTSPITIQALKTQIEHSSIQADVPSEEKERRDELVFGQNDDIINIGKLDSIESLKISSARREIFVRMQSIIQIEFNLVAPTLKHIVNEAPKEIMLRFVRGVEIKTGFPAMIHTMFQCGIQARRKKESEAKGESVEVKYPAIPTPRDQPILNFNKILQTLESKFVNGSAWEALSEIKVQLKEFLTGLDGDSRFKLYDSTNLHVFWRLLAWTKSLWSIVLFEEELEGVVDVYGKDLWEQELREWTGLILKTDWRDFYVSDLEIIVRKHSLSILEHIVTSGYFEQRQRRYEILYRVVKDTLVNEHLRDEANLKSCLAILTWLIPDKTIFKYLCIGNNDGNCLAYLIGEYVLKCFRATKDPYRATKLLIYYFNLLETLMLDEGPHYYYSSKIARPDAYSTIHVDTDEENDEEPEPKSEGQNENTKMGTAVEDEKMDEDVADLMCTQFACPEKYKLEEDEKERVLNFNKNPKLVPCWICPQEWEATELDPAAEKPCQCRKALLGNTFIMLLNVVEFWKVSFQQSENRINELEIRAHLELQRLEENSINVEQNGSTIKTTQKREKLSENLKSIRDFIVTNSNVKDEDRSKVGDWTWDELLKQSKSSLPESDWIDQRLRQDNIFDYAIRRGVMFMHYYNIEIKNMAVALGSEAFRCSTLIFTELRYYIENMMLSDTERNLIEELTQLEDESEGSAEESSSFMYDDDTDEDSEQLSSFIPKNVTVALDALPDIDLPKFSEKIFDEGLRCVELESL